MTVVRSGRGCMAASRTFCRLGAIRHPGCRRAAFPLMMEHRGTSTPRGTGECGYRKAEGGGDCHPQVGKLRGACWDARVPECPAAPASEMGREISPRRQPPEPRPHAIRPGWAADPLQAGAHPPLPHQTPLPLRPPPSSPRGRTPPQTPRTLPPQISRVPRLPTHPTPDDESVGFWGGVSIRFEFIGAPHKMKLSKPGSKAVALVKVCTLWCAIKLDVPNP
jgi:hypothetical protein